MTQSDVGKKRFGKWLAQEIRRRDWDQTDFAKRLGINRGSVSNWVRGKRRPGRIWLIEIADLLNTPIERMQQLLDVAAPGEYPAEQDTRGDMMRLAGSVKWTSDRVEVFEMYANMWKEEDRRRRGAPIAAD